jgi:large subunit ribosomal protein L29
MKMTELKDLNSKDLQSKLGELEKKLFDMKIQLGNQQLKNYMEIKEVKKSIARINTVMSGKKKEIIPTPAEK